MDLLSLLTSRAKAYTWAIIAVIFLETASTIATLYLPSLNASIIDDGVAQGDVPFIWRVGLVMLAVAFIQVITAGLAVWFGVRTAMATGRDLRRAIFVQVTRFSSEDISHFGAATLITRGTNDVQQIQITFLMMLNFLAPVPIMMIGGIIMAVREDPGLSWLVLVSAIVLAVVVGALIAALMPLFQSLQKKIDTLNAILREQISGVRVVRAFSREEHESQRFEDANADLTHTSLRIGNLFVLVFPVISLIMNGATGAVLWFGSRRVDMGVLQVGSLTAFLQYLMQILAAVMMGAFMTMMLPRAIVCARRISEILNREPSIQEPTDAVDLSTVVKKGVVEFSQVSFSYPGAKEAVLKDISFIARPGETTAIIGSTGAGKSTLLALIPRLYAATAGRVSIDGVDVRDMARADLVEYVSMVPQRPYLFSGTVASNLRLARPDASEEDLWAALDTAQAEFVAQHEDGLSMPIAQGGTNVSGGQRQRLSIARALLARPKVFLFDDSLSALDVITDAAVRRALKSVTKEAAVIVVAQRVSSIKEADRILVLEAGQIVARGTHEELLEHSAAYREIVYSQLGEEVA